MARTAAANAPGRSAPYTSTRRVSANPGWYASFGHLASSDDEDEDTLPGRSAGSSTRGAASRTAALDAADENDDEFTDDAAEALMNDAHDAFGSLVFALDGHVLH